MNKQEFAFSAADILLPDFDRIDGTRWAIIACDQFTSEGAYWESVAKKVGDAPSALSMILPEYYLAETATRVPYINASMEKNLREHLQSHPDAMIYLERTQSDGAIRRGIIGAVDLEAYDYQKGSTSLIRATEGTVLERIPPRVAIRRDAPLELPHIMLLIDDPHRTVIEPLSDTCTENSPIYDFDLMEDGGHVRGFLLDIKDQARILEALAALITPTAMNERYHDASLAPLLFAVGDGNHSLATAKACYEELKEHIGAEAAYKHPARYALAEVVNLHEEALGFEPIYRVVFGCKVQDLLQELRIYLQALHGNAAPQALRFVTATEEGTLEIPTPVQQLTVGTLQAFLDAYKETHPEIEIDYIHGEDSLRSLTRREDAIGFLFDGMRKDELFRSVMYDGALPRKTFSMGHARDKRYYLESRKIK